MPTLKPLNAAAILDAVAGKRLAVTMEEHWIVGGLGSAVAEMLADLANLTRTSRNQKAKPLRH